MIPIYSPRDEMELINLRSILLAAEIPFFVHNDHFGSMQIGLRIDLFNAKAIYVPQATAESARELIDDYVENFVARIIGRVTVCSPPIAIKCRSDWIESNATASTVETICSGVNFSTR